MCGSSPLVVAKTGRGSSQTVLDADANPRRERQPRYHHGRTAQTTTATSSSVHHSECTSSWRWRKASPKRLMQWLALLWSMVAIQQWTVLVRTVLDVTTSTATGAATGAAHQQQQQQPSLGSQYEIASFWSVPTTNSTRTTAHAPAAGGGGGGDAGDAGKAITVERQQALLAASRRKIVQKKSPPNGHLTTVNNVDRTVNGRQGDPRKRMNKANGGTTTVRRGQKVEQRRRQWQKRADASSQMRSKEGGKGTGNTIIGAATAGANRIDNVKARILLEYHNEQEGTGNTEKGIDVTSMNDVPGLHVVVSHCDAPMNWIWERLLISNQTDATSEPPLPWKSLTVITKCQRPPVGPHDLPPKLSSTASASSSAQSSHLLTPDHVLVVELPNVGRCDHSYSYWIDQYMARRNGPKSNHRRPVESFSIFDKVANNKNVVNDGNEHGSNGSPYNFHPQDFVMFVKDNDNSYRQLMEHKVSWQTLKNDTMATGFGCASRAVVKGGRALNVAARRNMGRFQMISYRRRNGKIEPTPTGDGGMENPTHQHDNTHDVSSTSQDNGMTTMFKSKYRVLQDWVDDLPIHDIQLGDRAPPVLNLTLPSDSLQFVTDDLFMPVCFGGHFVTTLERIEMAPVSDWSAIVHSLSRGDNIEEGHFMERMWAVLLSPPIPREDQIALLQTVGLDVIRRRNSPYKGLMQIKSTTTE